MLIASLLHGLAYLLLLPPWMGEDEPWHVEYAHYVGRGHFPGNGRKISVADLEHSSASQVQVLREIGSVSREEIHSTQAEILESMRRFHFWERVDWAGNGDAAENFDQVSPYLTATHQPPLYYVVVGQVLRLTGGDVLVEMWVLRGLSLLAYLAVVLASYEVARRLTSDPWIPLVCALLAAWWPMHARQAAVVNNDVLVKVFSAWGLVLALEIGRRGATRGRLVLGALLAALAVATKATGAGVLFPLGLAWFASRPASASSGVRLRRALVALVAVAAVPLVFLFSNNPSVPHTWEEFENRLTNAFSSDFIAEFNRTSVGAFNWYSRNLPDEFHWIVGVFLALGTLGLVLAFLRKQADLQRGLLLLCLAGVIAQASLIVLRGTAAGRYALPMLPACAALLAVGWIAPLPQAARRIASLGVLLVLLSVDAYFLWAGLVWNQYGVWGS